MPRRNSNAQPRTRTDLDAVLRHDHKVSEHRRKSKHRRKRDAKHRYWNQKGA